MNILLIHQYFLETGDGGGSRFNEMTRFWQAQGCAITVIAGMVHYTTGKKYPKFKGKYIVKEAVAPGITVYRCHVSEAYNKNFIGRLWAYFSFVMSSVIAVLRLKGHFDVVLVTSPPLFVAITGMFCSAIKRIPFVFEVRDLWPESAIDTGVLTNRFLIRAAFFLEKLTYKRAAMINTLTPAFRKKLIEEKKVSAANVCMIPNAADFSISDAVAANFDREAFRRDLGLDAAFVIIYVGAHGVANHLEQLLDAAELLKSTNALFLLIGDGMRKPSLVEAAKQRNVSSVRFIDPVAKQKIFEFILAADVGTSVLKNVATFKTVYSNKTFDYMACRKPVLMAIDGVSRELVERAECGVFVEPENPAQFADKVRWYMQHPDILRLQGENGYAYAKRYFDRSVLAIEYLEQLRRLV